MLISRLQSESQKSDICVRVTLELYGWCQDLDILTYFFSESYDLFQNNFFSQRSKAEVRIQNFSSEFWFLINQNLF